MTKLDFLTIAHVPDNQLGINRLLDLYQQKTGQTVTGKFANWNAIWRESINVGIYNKGADFSEIGTTWLESLVSMNSLRPFSESDLEQLGGKDSFLPGSWSSTMLGGVGNIWGIPLRADTRVLWYWKDMLEEAGLDPETAFASMDGLPQTFDALRSVIASPWAVPTNSQEANTMQVLASWIWQAGGDLLSADGKKVLFAEPAALKGMRAFFDLYRYMPKLDSPMNATEINRLFSERKICATIGGHWLLVDLENHNIPTDRVGVTLIPGPAFVGGTLAVIYKDCREPESVIRFLKFLLEPQNQLPYSRVLGLLPTRRDTWGAAYMPQDALHKALYQAVLQGRSYPSAKLFGIIEQRLFSTVGSAWGELFSQKNPDVGRIIEDHFAPLARRLQVMADA